MPGTKFVSAQARRSPTALVVPVLRPTTLGLRGSFAALAERIGGEPGLAPEEILHWFFPNLFGATVAPLMIGDPLDLVDRWRPDLLVHDTTALAGPLAAAVAQVPSVAHSIGLRLPADVFRLREPVAPLWERHGLGVEPMGGSFRGPCLSIAPPDLETPVDARFSKQIRPLRTVGFSAAADEGLPGWMADLPERPTVYVTLGTFLNSDRAVFRPCSTGRRKSR